jgi:hypothetical protein
MYLRDGYIRVQGNKVDVFASRVLVRHDAMATVALGAGWRLSRRMPGVPPLAEAEFFDARRVVGSP